MITVTQRLLDFNSETQRLHWLIEWVNEHASFTESEWHQWQRLQEAEEPWLIDEEM